MAMLKKLQHGGIAIVLLRLDAHRRPVLKNEALEIDIQKKNESKLIASQFKEPNTLVWVFTSTLMIKGNRSNYDTFDKRFEY